MVALCRLLVLVLFTLIGVGTVHVDMLFSVCDPKHPVFHHVFICLSLQV